MGKKLIFLDIDGTLTPAGSNIPPESAMTAIHAPRAVRWPLSAKTGTSSAPASAGPTNVAAGMTPPNSSTAVASAVITPLIAMRRAFLFTRPPPSRPYSTRGRRFPAKLVTIGKQNASQRSRFKIIVVNLHDFEHLLHGYPDAIINHQSG